jgi:hypothetical protein
MRPAPTASPLPKKPFPVENLVMFQIRVAAIALVVSVSVTALSAPLAMAQASDTAQATGTAQGSDMAASTPKQVQKAQRKAERKAARAKKNAELKELEKNGYQPGGDQTNYPQNLQDAEKKSAAAKAKAASGQ